jgi:hypothetical protein
MVAEGRIDEVRAYCEADVLNLAGLYFRGRTSPAVPTPRGMMPRSRR